MLPMSVTYGDSEAVVSARCYRSMKKNEAPHSVQVMIGMQQTTVSGKCSCVAGVADLFQCTIHQGGTFLTYIHIQPPVAPNTDYSSESMAPEN